MKAKGAILGAVLLVGMQAYAEDITVGFEIEGLNSSLAPKLESLVKKHPSIKQCVVAGKKALVVIAEENEFGTRDLEADLAMLKPSSEGVILGLDFRKLVLLGGCRVEFNPALDAAKLGHVLSGLQGIKIVPGETSTTYVFTFGRSVALQAQALIALLAPRLNATPENLIQSVTWIAPARRRDASSGIVVTQNGSNAPSNTGSGSPSPSTSSGSTTPSTKSNSPGASRGSGGSRPSTPNAPTSGKLLPPTQAEPGPLGGGGTANSSGNPSGPRNMLRDSITVPTIPNRPPTNDGNTSH